MNNFMATQMSFTSYKGLNLEIRTLLFSMSWASNT